MNKISREDVQHVALLARLRLTEEELERFTKELNDIITYMDKLNELDTTNVPATSHILGITNVMRQDVVKQSLSREEALANAPEQRDGQFKVPAVFS